MTMFAEHPKECPKGYTVKDQWDTPYERLVDYAMSLKEEHNDLLDRQINKPAPFIGKKRSARWEDERKRRGLIS